jgi:hypothetical protein
MSPLTKLKIFWNFYYKYTAPDRASAHDGRPRSSFSRITIHSSPTQIVKDQRPFRPINQRFYTINSPGVIAPRNKNAPEKRWIFTCPNLYQPSTNNYQLFKGAQISKISLKILHLKSDPRLHLRKQNPLTASRASNRSGKSSRSCCSPCTTARDHRQKGDSAPVSGPAKVRKVNR